MKSFFQLHNLCWLHLYLSWWWPHNRNACPHPERWERCHSSWADLPAQLGCPTCSLFKTQRCFFSRLTGDDDSVILARHLLKWWIGSEFLVVFQATWNVGWDCCQSFWAAWGIFLRFCAPSFLGIMSLKRKITVWSQPGFLQCWLSVLILMGRFVDVLLLIITLNFIVKELLVCLDEGRRNLSQFF